MATLFFFGFFFLTSSFSPFLGFQNRELSQFHLGKSFHCLADLTTGNSFLTLKNQNCCVIFVALKGRHSYIFFPSFCIYVCVYTHVYIWL